MKTYNRIKSVNMMKAILRKIRDYLRSEWSFFQESFDFWLRLRKYNASSHTDRDIEKLQYTLLRENHTIEKGLSMRNTRKGFGQPKVTRLLSQLEKYNLLYGNIDITFLQNPINTIQNYINYTKSQGVDIKVIENKLDGLLGKTGLVANANSGGIELLKKEDVLGKCDKTFESLLYSRHSIRYFSNVPVEESQIKKALELAQRTPSACNRQGWKTHVFQGDESIQLIKWQEGSRGFEEEIRCSILVTANLKAFLYYEVHQAYIDGGLYAMNLINALHSLGLGTIPLSCGFRYQKLKKLRNFGIPDNEVPILIIGVGNLPDSFKIAVSNRKEISETNRFHK